MRRVAPAVALFLLAPLVAEFLLGNLPITALPTLAVLAPLYGGGALLIRETTRRLGRGWPTMTAFAAAYGVLEEGIATMSLFNPHYANAHLMDTGYVPALGIAVPWTLTVITMHTAWSICTPIALVETLTRDRRTQPWLGRPALAVTTALLAAGVAGTIYGTDRFSPYTLSPAQLTAAITAMTLLITLGLLLGRTPRKRPTHRAPTPWATAALSLTAGLTLRALPLAWNPWLTTTLILTITAAALTAIHHWSTAPTWSPAHHLALATGALLSYALLSFPQPPVFPAPPAIDLTGNAIFTAAAVALILATARSLRGQPVPVGT